VCKSLLPRCRRLAGSLKFRKRGNNYSVPYQATDPPRTSDSSLGIHCGYTIFFMIGHFQEQAPKDQKVPVDPIWNRHLLVESLWSIVARRPDRPIGVLSFKSSDEAKHPSMLLNLSVFGRQTRPKRSSDYFQLWFSFSITFFFEQADGNCLCVTTWFPLFHNSGASQIDACVWCWKSWFDMHRSHLFFAENSRKSS